MDRRSIPAPFAPAEEQILMDGVLCRPCMHIRVPEWAWDTQQNGNDSRGDTYAVGGKKLPRSLTHP